MKIKVLFLRQIQTLNTWGEIFQDPNNRKRILDRVLHHATVINIVGDSYRLKDHIKKETEES